MARYEALGLCEPGGGGELIETGQVTHGGKWVVNPSGGLISKGHPLGATGSLRVAVTPVPPTTHGTCCNWCIGAGLAQCAELSWQLRGEAEKRQVPNASVALQVSRASTPTRAGTAVNVCNCSSACGRATVGTCVLTMAIGCRNCHCERDHAAQPGAGWRVRRDDVREGRRPSSMTSTVAAMFVTR